MEYEYKEAGFKKASEAVIAFESGIELLVINNAVDTFSLVNIYGACVNFDSLYTRKEKAIDFEKEFVLDTPWMVSDYATNDYIFRYACAYLPNSKSRFIALESSLKSKKPHRIMEWAYARHLTKEEEIEYLGADK